MTADAVKTLRLLREYGLKVAAPETSCSPYEYAFWSMAGADKTIPSQFHISRLWGHCAAMACTVQAALGGDIVTGRIEAVQHYWNRLPDGTEVDLTSCQFGGDGMTPLAKGRRVAPRKRTAPRFILFAARISEAIRNDTKDLHESGPHLPSHARPGRTGDTLLLREENMGREARRKDKRCRNSKNRRSAEAPSRTGTRRTTQRMPR